jgi:hypothetical protein
MFDALGNIITESVDKFTKDGVKVGLSDDTYLKLGLTIVGSFLLCTVIYFTSRTIFNK